MKILMISATQLEVEKLLQQLEHQKRGENHYQIDYANLAIDLHICGIGMLATAFQMGKLLQQSNYDLAINLGVCGAFDRTLQLGEAVLVQEDRIAEEGAEDGEKWLSLEEIGLRKANEFPFQDNCLKANYPSGIFSGLEIKKVKGISVNRVHGWDQSIEKVEKYFQPQVESMEGAAFYYACNSKGLPAFQLRTVSNFVENRNRESWKMEDALFNLAEITIKILDNVKK